MKEEEIFKIPSTNGISNKGAYVPLIPSTNLAYTQIELDGVSIRRTNNNHQIFSRDVSRIKNTHTF